MRYFNTSGPNIPSQHYTLYRQELIAEGIEMVEQSRYFTLWAPRQTGKSTYFLQLAEELKGLGYRVATTSVEDFKNGEKEDILNYFNTELSRQWQLSLAVHSIQALFQYIESIKESKLVWVIDEIENYNPAFLNEFLHSIRKVYHSRQHHALKSVILVGVSNIAGIMQDNASPFNIADSLPIPYFTREETFDLLGQHEAETGQRFEEKVKAKISEITANQPGLVNGFAYQLVRNNKGKDLIRYEDYLKVEDWYLTRAIDKNFSNVLNKVIDYRPFLENLLFRETKISFRIDRPEIKFLHTLGLIQADENGDVVFWVPYYKKRLFEALYPYTNGEKEEIQKNLILKEFQNEAGQINFDKIIQAYQEYVKRRGFNYFREKDEQGNYKSIKEAALMYSFETYIQAFLQEFKGKCYREAHTGLGKSDLIVNIAGKEVLMESKIYYSPSRFERGKIQLAYYAKSLGLQEGIYLVFVNNHIELPESVIEAQETIEGILIKTFLVFYDEKKDF